MKILLQSLYTITLKILICYVWQRMLYDRLQCNMVFEKNTGYFRIGQKCIHCFILRCEKTLLLFRCGSNGEAGANNPELLYLLDTGVWLVPIWDEIINRKIKSEMRKVSYLLRDSEVYFFVRENYRKIANGLF